jgi:hypothetical protein
MAVIYPLLHTLLTEGKEAVRQKFGLPHSKIRWVRIFKGFFDLGISITSEEQQSFAPSPNPPHRGQGGH